MKSKPSKASKISNPPTFLNKKQSRKDNTLKNLTNQFIDHIKRTSESRIDLTKLADALHVSKRRIYDVTNVLEGIGYIKKHAKNQITWLKNDFLNSPKEEAIAMDDQRISDLKKLRRESEQLDAYINEIKAEIEDLTQKAEWKDYGFITYEDLMGMVKEQNCKLIAIQAPDGTSLDVIEQKDISEAYKRMKSDMEEGRVEMSQEALDLIGKRYQIYLESPNGEISVYLIKTNEEMGNDIGIGNEYQCEESNGICNTESLLRNGYEI